MCALTRMVREEKVAGGRAYYAPARASESKQPVDLDDEGAVRELGKAGDARVALIVVDDEQLAAGTVLPAQAHVRRERRGGRVVLEERADEHQRRHRVGDAAAHEAR